MAGMDAGPGTDPGSLGFYSGTWVVMMAAMMLPLLWMVVIAVAIAVEKLLPWPRAGTIGWLRCWWHWRSGWPPPLRVCPA